MSPNNYLRNNTLANNDYNFGFWIDGMINQHYADIDDSNTVDGKPILYYNNTSDIIIDQTLTVAAESLQIKKDIVA